MLDREVDISRGDVLTHPGETPEFSNQFQARVIWMKEEPAFPGRSYLLKIGAQLVPATITDLKFRTNVNTLEQSAAKTLELNEVGTLTIATDKPIAFDSYVSNPLTGAFILIDRITQRHARVPASSISACAARRTSAGRVRREPATCAPR